MESLTTTTTTGTVSLPLFSPYKPKDHCSRRLLRISASPKNGNNGKINSDGDLNSDSALVPILRNDILSQVLEEVVDKRSTTYNEGRIFIHGANDSTVNAFKKQFERDLGGFLRSRSEELKSRGSMFLVFLGRTSSDPIDQGGAGLLFGTHYQDAWNDLVEEGEIAREKRDKFNIPIYAASLEEFKEVVESEGSFIINKLQVFKGGSPLVVDKNRDDAAEVGRALATSCRSVSGVLVDVHIGDRLSDELFSRVARRAMSQGKDLLDLIQFFHIVASLSLA